MMELPDENRLEDFVYKITINANPNGLLDKIEAFLRECAYTMLAENLLKLQRHAGDDRAGEPYWKNYKPVTHDRLRFLVGITKLLPEGELRVLTQR